MEKVIEHKFRTGAIALIDKSIYDKIDGWISLATARPGKSYVKIEKKGQKYSYLHRIIMNAKKGEFVDHINGNGLDNRRENLRICSYSENNRNSRKIKASKYPYKGVKSAYGGKFKAIIVLDKKEKYIGTFATQIEAAIAYDEAALKIHKEFAKTNKMLGLI